MEETEKDMTMIKGAMERKSEQLDLLEKKLDNIELTLKGLLKLMADIASFRTTHHPSPEIEPEAPLPTDPSLSKQNETEQLISTDNMFNKEKEELFTAPPALDGVKKQRTYRIISKQNEKERNHSNGALASLERSSNLSVLSGLKYSESVVPKGSYAVKPPQLLAPTPPMLRRGSYGAPSRLSRWQQNAKMQKSISLPEDEQQSRTHNSTIDGMLPSKDERWTAARVRRRSRWGRPNIADAAIAEGMSAATLSALENESVERAEVWWLACDCRERERIAAVVRVRQIVRCGESECEENVIGEGATPLSDNRKGKLQLKCGKKKMKGENEHCLGRTFYLE